MSNFFKNPKNICTIILGLFIIASLVVQFIPYWTFEQFDEIESQFKEKTASIADYVWSPRENDGALDLFNEGNTGKEIEANTVALPMAGQFALGLLAIAFIITKFKKWFSGLFAFLSGGLGLFGYLTVAPLKLNASIWIAGIITSVLVLIAGLVKLYINKIFKDKTNAA